VPTESAEPTLRGSVTDDRPRSDVGFVLPDGVSGDCLAVAARVSQGRLEQRLARLAVFGAVPGGGVAREALGDADLEAHAFLVAEANALACSAALDAAGNLYLRRAGVLQGPPVVTGSHVDTQPLGGSLDGAYGVCAGLETIAALNDCGLSTLLPIEVVVWSNEEGCRFPPGSLGSQAFVERQRLAALLDVRDAGGLRYGDAVDALRARLAPIAELPLERPFHAFIEAHIEQGPVLEAAGLPIGVVSAVQGVRWFRVHVTGAAAHAGTTPRAFRRDALRAAVSLIDELHRYAECTDGLALTVGRLEVDPGAINTIAGSVDFTVDVRHVDGARLGSFESMLLDACHAGRMNCAMRVERLMALDTTPLDGNVCDVLRASAAALGLGSTDIVSGAFHDSVHLATHCPTGMLFVPSRQGISHHPAEYTAPELLCDGARVLAATLAAVAGICMKPRAA
jgi:N-carbamoyl-L-amino-acid hydrolase